jgi:hypothetical protein
MTHFTSLPSSQCIRVQKWQGLYFIVSAATRHAILCLLRRSLPLLASSDACNQAIAKSHGFASRYQGFVESMTLSAHSGSDLCSLKIICQKRKSNNIYYSANFERLIVVKFIVPRLVRFFNTSSLYQRHSRSISLVNEEESLEQFAIFSELS